MYLDEIDLVHLCLKKFHELGEFVSIMLHDVDSAVAIFVYEDG